MQATKPKGEFHRARVLNALMDRYSAVHDELSELIDRNGPDVPKKVWQRRHEHIEYLFGVEDGLRLAINALDPSKWDGARLRDFSTWERSLQEPDSRA